MICHYHATAQAEKLPTMKAAIVIELARDTGKMVRRLVRLKQIFPGGNVSKLVTRCPALVLMVSHESVASNVLLVLTGHGAVH